MALYLVTGGAGFIGSHLVETLLRRGQQVRVLDNFSTGSLENVKRVQAAVRTEGKVSGGELECIAGDLCSYHLVCEAVQGVDFILHQGALPSVPRSVHDPITSNQVNVAGTLNLLHAARAAKVQRFVLASSSSIYGSNPQLPKAETMPPMPMSPYAVSKLAGEYYCRTFYELYGLETVCLRYFNVFGERQDPQSAYAAVIPKFIMAALAEQPVLIHGDGTQSRDFTYVRNVVEANLLACEAPQAVGKVFNISCGERHSLLDVVQELEQLLEQTIEICYDQARAGDVQHSQADITQAKRLLEYEPLVRFRDGLAATVPWYQATWVGTYG